MEFHPYSAWKRTPDDGQRRGPKHVAFYDRINLDDQCVCLVIKRKSVPMHGNMNVKYFNVLILEQLTVQIEIQETIFV